MRNWDNISDYELEAVVADLLGAEDRVRYERFARGPDQGIDLRHLGPGSPDVVQCKHYKGSTWPTLKAAVKREGKKLPDLDPAPAPYRLVSTQRLTPARKAELAALLAPFVTADDQIHGLEDLEGLLNRPPEVERRHVKLWLASGTQLGALLRPGTATR